MPKNLASCPTVPRLPSKLRSETGRVSGARCYKRACAGWLNIPNRIDARFQDANQRPARQTDAGQVFLHLEADHRRAEAVVAGEELALVGVPLDAVIDLVGGRTLIDALVQIGGVEVEGSIQSDAIGPDRAVGRGRVEPVPDARPAIRLGLFGRLCRRQISRIREARDSSGE